MNGIVILSALLGCVAAAPGLYYHDIHSHDIHSAPVLHSIHSVSSPSKTTITKNSQVVNHGGHKVVHVPIHHEPLHLVHEPVHVVQNIHTPVHVLEQKHEPATSSQYFKLENTQYKTTKVAPVVKVASLVPVVHAVHTPVYHAPVYHTQAVSRSGDSAVSHHSSTVHETVHEVEHLPLYTLHH